MARKRHITIQNRKPEAPVEGKPDQREQKVFSPSGRRLAACHPDRLHHAKGLCLSCYGKFNEAQRKLEQEQMAAAANGGESPRSAMDVKKTPRPDPPEKTYVPIRWRNPDTLEYLCRAVIKHKFDWYMAVREIAPELNVAEAAEEASKLRENIAVREAIEDALVDKGLDEKSKSAFVKRMWKWLDSGDEKLMRAAAGILGRGFISDKIDVNKTEELPIRGFKEGVTKLFGEAIDPNEESETVQ
jgi:hypothetical protein